MVAGRDLAHATSWVTERVSVLGLSECEEARAFCERTSVGRDVHARSVVAAAIDGQTGEVFEAGFTSSHTEVLECRTSGPVCGGVRVRADWVRIGSRAEDGGGAGDGAR